VKMRMDKHGPHYVFNYTLRASGGKYGSITTHVVGNEEIHF